MNLQPDVKFQERLLLWSKYLAWSVMAISLTILTGWHFNIEMLKHPIPGLSAMNPTTAVLFILGVLSLVLLTSKPDHKGKKICGKFFATVIVLVSGIKLFSLITNSGFEIDNFLYHKKLVEDLYENIPNRMAPNAAVCLLFTGISLFIIDRETHRKQIATQYLSIIIMLVALFSLIEYIYQVKAFYFLGDERPMAIYAAICFILISIAILFTHPSQGLMKQFTSIHTGSAVARHMIPSALLIPFFLGLLRLYGAWSNLYSLEFGVAVFVLLIILAFLITTWYNVVLLNKRDIQKAETEKELRESHEQIQAIYNGAPDAVIVINEMRRIVHWNKQAEILFHWQANEVLGKSLSDIIIPPQFRHAHRQELERFVSTGKSEIIDTNIELKGVRKDGTEIDMALSISPTMLKGKYLFVGFIRDITEKKKNEEQLKRFNERLEQEVKLKTEELRSIFERITDGFIALDNNYCYTYANKKIGELLNRDPQSLIGKCVWDEYPEAVNTETYKAFQKAMKEQCYITNTDNYEPLKLWHENHIYPSPTGLSIYFRDITDKRKAEQKLQKEKELSDKIINSLPGLFYLSDQTPKLLMWNKMLEKVSGYSARELENIFPISLFVPEDHFSIRQNLEKIYKEGSADVEARILTKEGKIIPFYLTGTRIEYDGKPAMLGTGIDISEREKIQREREKMRSENEGMINSTTDLLWSVSKDLKLISANGSFIKGLKDNGGFLIKPGDDILPPDHFPDDYLQYWKSFYNKGLAGENILTEIFTPKAQSSEFDWFEIKINPIYTDHSITGVACSMRNVNVRKRAENEIRKANERFELVAKATGDAVWDWNITENEIWGNDTLYTFFGLDRGQSKLNRDMFFEHVHPDDVNKVKGMLDKAHKHSAEYLTEEFRLKKPDGTYRTVIDRAYISYDKSGKPVRLIGAMQDISERVNATQALKVSEEKFRTLVQQAAEGIFIVDQDGNYLEANDSAAILTGYTKEELKKMNATDLVYEEDLKKNPIKLEEIKKGLPVFTERIIKRKDGTLIQVEISAKLMDTGDVISILKDITDRKKVERKLKDSEERLRLSLLAANQGLYDLKVQTGDAIVNDQYATMLGYDPETFVETNSFWLERLHPADLARTSKAYMDYVQGKTDEYKVEFRQLTKDKKWKWILSLGKIVEYDANGKPIRMLGTHTDITDRKKAEEALQKAEKRLQFLLSATPAVIYSSEAEYPFASTFISENITEQTGYTPDDFLNNPNFWSDHIHPDDKERVLKNFEQVFKSGRYTHEYRFCMKDGNYFWMHDEVKIIYGEEGNPVEMVGYWININERKKAEIHLKESEENYRQIVETTHEGVWMIDREGHTSFVNERITNILGYSKKEMLGKHLFDFIDEEGKEIAKRNMRRRKLGIAEDYEFKFISKDGFEKWTLLSTSPYEKDGQYAGSLALVTDITERKKVEIEKEGLLNILKASLNEVYIFNSGSLLFEYVNNCACTNLGYSPEEMLRITPLDIKPEYTPERFRKLIAPLLKLEKEKIVFETVHERKDKSRYPVEVHLQLVTHSGKSVFLAVIIDITDRKKAEDQLIKEKGLSDSIINSLPGIFYLIDEKGELLRWNKNLEAVSGYTTEEMLKLNTFDFFDTNEKIIIRKKIAAVFEKGREEVEAHFLTKDRKKIPYYFNGWRVIFEGKPCLIGVGIDITERRNAEMEMFIANERFGLIARATNDFVWDAYLDIKKIWWNDNYYTQLGWKKGIEIPGADSWENHIHKSDKKRVLERLTHILDHTTESIWTEEYRFGKADGTYITVYDRGYIMRDDKRKAYRVIGAMTDISGIKKTEELLKKSYDDIRRLASHLEKAREDERISIAREIHDELGQQLTVLKMDASWLNKNTLLQDKKVKQRIVGLIQMIDKTIITIRRIASELRPSVLDDLGLLPALEWLSIDFEKRSGIKTKFVSELTELNLDSNVNTAMFRIFQESLTNVARHAQASEVCTLLKKENGNLLITIKDNGNGFVVSSLENKKTLGIVGIKERVALIDGEYEIISSPNQGTTVKVKVPVSSITEPKTSP